jgi:hypothetical protein
MGDNQFFVSGSVASLPALRWRNDHAVVDANDLSALRERTVPSMVGLDDANVFDETARKSAESSEVEFASSWPELDAVLAQIAAKMHLNMRLEAHIGKLLLYESGSFFRAHRDAEHRPGHFISLVLDLASDADGGSVSFGAPSAISDRLIADMTSTTTSSSTTKWHSRANAWAAWFASSWHSVDEITRGYRVVLTFDVVVAHVDVAAPLFPSPTTRHGGVPPFAALVWDNIASFLSLGDCARLSRTCHGLNAIVGGDSARLLARHLRAHSSRLVRALERRKYHSIGAVCRHAYLFDQTSQTVSPSLLKGRDRTFAEALRQLGYKVTVRRVTLLDEFPTDEEVVLKRCRIGLTVLDRRFNDSIFKIAYDDEQDDASIECAALLAQLLPKVRVRDYGFIGDTQTEFDGELREGFQVVPFPGVLWFETLSSLMSAWNTATGLSCDNLWGNQSMFGLRSFEACAIVGEVLNVDDMEQVELASDIYARHCELFGLAKDDTPES